ncbi:MAG: hypothetical protein ACK5MV_07590 [Aminipila sp.]
MKEVLIPDEYIPDYSLPREEEEKRYAEHTKNASKAWDELEKMKDTTKKTR